MCTPLLGDDSVNGHRIHATAHTHSQGTIDRLGRSEYRYSLERTSVTSMATVVAFVQQRYCRWQQWCSPLRRHVLIAGASIQRR